MQPIYAVHCTRKSNLSSILNIGLEPRHPEGEHGNYRGCGLSDQPTGVYFGAFDAVWGGEVAIVVDVRGFKYARDQCIRDAFVVTEKISAERIIQVFISVPSVYEPDGKITEYPRAAEQARAWAEHNRERGTVIYSSDISTKLLMSAPVADYEPKFYDPMEAFGR